MVNDNRHKNMTWFSRTDGAWTETSSPSDEGPSIQIRASESERAPDVRFLMDGQTFFDVSGVDPRPQTDTTHTVAMVDPESSQGDLVFAVHAAGNDLLFEDCRGRESISDTALEQAQSALNEILVPVYIDDVVSDVSEAGSGLALLHTVQTNPESDGWSYFRTSMFRDGELLIEEERGTLSA